MHLFSHINALLVATFISLMNLPQVTQADDLITTSTLSRIAFGSCNCEQKPQPLWPFIAQDKPSLWIWTGDNIYADTKDPQIFRTKYDLQMAQPGYAAPADPRHTLGYEVVSRLRRANLRTQSQLCIQSKGDHLG